MQTNAVNPARADGEAAPATHMERRRRALPAAPAGCRIRCTRPGLAEAERRPGPAAPAEYAGPTAPKAQRELPGPTGMKPHRAPARRLFLCLLALILLTTASGCTTYTNFKNTFFPEHAQAETQPIRIAVYEPMTGKSSAQGEQEVIGFELAHELYPTVVDKPVELIYGDNQSNMYVAENTIQELLEQKPSVVLGSYGEVLTLVAGDYIKAASTPAITVSATNPLITANNTYYFSATFPEDKQGELLADYAYTASNKNVVATVRTGSDDQATAAVTRFSDRMHRITKNNDSVVGNFTVSSENPDLETVIERIRESGAKAVFLDMSPATAQVFLQTAVDLRLTHILWLGPRTWNDENLQAFVHENDKLDVAYPADFSQTVATETTEIFLDAYREKYGEETQPSETTAIAFDAYLLALDAIERAQTSAMETTEEDLAERFESDTSLKAAVAELKQAQESGIPTGHQILVALMETTEFQGASGVISYNGSNEAQKTISIERVSGGQDQPSYALTTTE